MCNEYVAKIVLFVCFQKKREEFFLYRLFCQLQFIQCELCNEENDFELVISQWRKKKNMLSGQVHKAIRRIDSDFIQRCRFIRMNSKKKWFGQCWIVLFIWFLDVLSGVFFFSVNQLVLRGFILQNGNVYKFLLCIYYSHT